MSSLEIFLLGKFSILQGDRELECFQSAQAKEPFSYLLLHAKESNWALVPSLGCCTTVGS
jgi:hypothetical protein